MAARPLEPAPKVNSDSSGNVVVNSYVSVPMRTSITRVVRRVGVFHAYRNPSRSWPGALGVRAEGCSSLVRMSNMAMMTAR